MVLIINENYLATILMRTKILNALKVSLLATVLSFGLSYAYAWTAPTATPPTGNVSAPINTSATAQIKTGALTTAGLTTTNRLTVGEAGGTYTYITMQDDESPSGVKYIHANSNVIGFLNSSGNWSSYWDNVGNQYNIGTIKATGGYVGNGPIPLTPHYVNRSEDTYSGPWTFYRYCNGFYNHDTCNGDYNKLYTCSKSGNIASCTDAYPYPSGTRTDWGWCGAYFYDRTVSCRPNEVLSTYDDNI